MGADTTTYQDTGLTPNTAYRYRLLAFNDFGNSGVSNEISITTLSATPAPPTNLVGQADIPTLSLASQISTVCFERNRSFSQICCEVAPLGGGEFLSTTRSFWMRRGAPQSLAT